MRAFEILTEDPIVKQRVIRGLAKKPDDAPIFQQVYKVLVGEPLSGRIKKYIEARGDVDAAAAIAELDRLIPTLGNAQEVKAFIAEFQKKDAKGRPIDFVNTKVAFPAGGMTKAAQLSSLVVNPFAKKLFDSLLTYKGKVDAGPGEAALAIMSPNITYAQGASTEEFGKGGDIIVNGVGKVEVKAKEGRLVSVISLEQSGMTKSLGGWTGSRKSISATELSKPLPPDFPKAKFMKAACLAWFGEVRPELVAAAGTPGFRRMWLNAMYQGYKDYAGFTGILFLSQGSYQYTISGEQIPDSYVVNWGALYKPTAGQLREICPSIAPKF
jgi:hypothetical protein